MGSRERVVVSGDLPGDAVPVLSESFAVDVAPSIAEADLAGASGLLSLVTDRIDASVLARAPALKVVANVAVGVDNVDLAACAARGVVVTNTPDVLTEATADLAFGLLLDAARRISEGDRLMRAGGWKAWTPTFHLGAKVHGMKLGVVGFGRIGMAMARRARGFGMHVGYTQRRRVPENLERVLGATFVPDLDELCATSDAITIHCPLTPETRGLFDAARLARMRPGSVLVNTARGPIVDEAALAKALRDGPLAAAGLDVYADEPRVHPDLLAREDVVLAPHIGSAERETREKMAATAAANVIAVLHGKAPLTPVR
ncbi:MAG: D-glycerate dehydrogenase [Labilithrix sp.]|nr:D-glycerate dehydrogenase [Labilithrix sp.]MCW5814373.1 D-glycerate dehydrogenase [Labilithrix sp.]